MNWKGGKSMRYVLPVCCTVRVLRLTASIARSRCRPGAGLGRPGRLVVWRQLTRTPSATGGVGLILSFGIGFSSAENCTQPKSLVTATSKWPVSGRRLRTGRPGRRRREMGPLGACASGPPE
jgi:hypothetical protein